MSESNWTVTGPQVIDVDDVKSLKLGMVRGRFDIVTTGTPWSAWRSTTSRAILSPCR